MHARMVFVPEGPVPSGGRFALWLASGASPEETARRLGLPAGDPGVIATVEPAADGPAPVDLPARLLPLLPTVRRLAAMPPGADWPAWSRPAAGVLAWSAAAKLALELVAAGRILPGVTTTRTPGEVRAVWRVAVASDPRPGRLAGALPVAAHALRRDEGGVWDAEELLMSFLDAVADACARQGRRPTLDRRRRGPWRPWAERWPEALIRADPTITGLRRPGEELSAEVDEWAAPLLGTEPTAGVRLALLLEPPPRDGDGGRTSPDEEPARTAPGTGAASWRLTWSLESVDDPSHRLPAADVWARGSRPLEVAERRLADPEAALLRGLAKAARLFPPLDRALSQAQPVELGLSTREVGELLGGGVEALVAAGVSVRLPPELAPGERRRLRLRARLRRSPAPAEPGGRRLPGLGSAAQLRYEAVIGDRELAEHELAELVALDAPLVRWRGEWVEIDRSEAERIRALAGSSEAVALTEALAAGLAGQRLVGDLGWVDTVADGPLAGLIERLGHGGRDEGAHIVGIDGRLRPYQERGVAWLQHLGGLGLGAVLADQMGLGKTLQAIALLTSRDQDRPHLVVGPTSVVGNWERELRRFAPDLPVVRHHGPDRPVSRSAFRPGRVVVTSYALLRRDVGLLTSVDWDVVVFDEAQQVKNPRSKGARAARELPAAMRLAMTGTPVENRLRELWSVIDLTNPGLLGGERAFTARFAAPIERWHDEDAAARLRRLVAPFVLRRRKDDPDVSVDLPAKQELTVACTLTSEQAALYRAVVERAFSGRGLGSTSFERRGRILALITALKQVCNHPVHYRRDNGPLARRSGKLTRATEILGELVDDGDRALVFTQFREMGELLQRHLGEELALDEVPFLHGGLSVPARDALVARFQEDADAPPLLLVSLRAGGTGLNLTRASHVLHFDRWWNPAVEDQATDRAHRIGQHRTVTVHTLVTTGTLEERIADLLERKRTLADAVVGGGETWLTELGDAELHELLALSSPGEDEPDDEPASVTTPPRLVAIEGGRR